MLPALRCGPVLSLKELQEETSTGLLTGVSLSEVSHG